jgi:hypothetical protein
MFIRRPENGLAKPFAPYKTHTKKEYNNEKISFNRVDGRWIGFRSDTAF